MMQPTILTHSGNYFNLLRPDYSTFTVGDIAHALSHICRYTGHVHTFYSVAQHSVAVSHLVPPEHALAGLMHDAAEAFIGDVSSPLKSLLPQYKAIEARVEAVIADRFGLTALMDPRVKELDDRILEDERCVLLCDPPFPWTPREPLGIRISPDALGNWRDEFLALAEYLGIQAMPPRLVLPPWEEVSDV